MRKVKNVFISIVVVMCVMACSLTFTQSAHSMGAKPSSQEVGEKEQENVIQRAQRAVRVPQVNNFITREAVAKWLKRMDVPRKTFYIYVFTPMGQPIGYYVSQHYPVPFSALMTPPERIYYNPNGNIKMTSPALDGVWYSGGSSGDLYYWFDAETDALISVKGFSLFFTDQPLSLNIDRIRVITNEKGAE